MGSGQEAQSSIAEVEGTISDTAAVFHLRDKKQQKQCIYSYISLHIHVYI